MKRKSLSYICLLSLFILFAWVIWNVADANAGGYPPPQMPIVIKVEKDHWTWLKWVLGIVAACVPPIVVLILSKRFFQVTKDDDDFEEQIVERRQKRRSKKKEDDTSDPRV